jgi:hypothetical protein
LVLEHLPPSPMPATQDEQLALPQSAEQLMLLSPSHLRSPQ